jgi:hypothetical protein
LDATRIIVTQKRGSSSNGENECEAKTGEDALRHEPPTSSKEPWRGMSRVVRVKE